MYRIARVRLHNICQYDDVDVPIEVGLTAVCGPNGRGKTNMIRAIGYGLTGLVDGSWGNQQKLQKDGTVDPGWVEIQVISDAGDSITIRRFSTSSTKFPDRIMSQVNGVLSEVAVRRKEVDRYMEGVFGIPCSLMFQIMWGRQGRLDDLLTSPPALVNSFLASVFDTKKLDKLREKLKVQLDTIANIPGNCVDLLSQYRTELSELPDVSVMETMLHEDEQKLSTAQAEYARLDGIMSTGWRKLDLNSRIHTVGRQISDIDRWLELNPATPEPQIPDIPLSQIELSAQQTNANIEQLRAKIYNNIQLESSTEYQLNENKHKLQQLTEDYNSKLEKLHEQDEICSLCKGHIVDRVGYERERCQMLTGFSSEDDFSAHVTAQINRLNEDISNGTKLVAEISELNEDLNQQLASDTQLLGNLNVLRDLHHAHDKWLSNQQTRSSELARRPLLVKQLEELKAAVPVDETTERQYFDAKALFEELHETVEATKREITSTQSSRQYLERSISEYEKAVSQYEINKEARNVLTTIRDVYSQSRAQARYLRSKIQQLNTRISEYMEQTGMPFSLYLNEDTHSFEYITDSGFVHPASHLSGAQKSISSVVLQMAVLSVVQPMMNLFLVDEPSEALDDENKIVMSSLFQRLNNLLPAMDGVMLIVTRDGLIIESCENVINVGD